MKNRIWKQMKKAGIVTVLAGAMLGGTIEPELTLGADFLPGQAPFIDQSVFWKDIESGQAELGIRIHGLNEWLSGRRFSEDKEKNEKWDDEFHKIEDPSVEQEKKSEQELPEDDLQQEEEPEQELPVDKVVEGNMGDKNRKFNFTINFSGPANTSFTFGNELITLDSNGSGSVNLQLSHEDAAAEITGIPSTVTYTVTENLNSSEGYDTDFAVSKGTGTSQAVAKDEAASDAAKVTAQQQTMTKADNAVTVTNRRVAASPTGVMLSITPYALSAGLASLLGALFFRRKKLS